MQCSADYRGEEGPFGLTNHVSAHETRNWHNWEGTINPEQYLQVLVAEFFRDGLACFSKTMLNNILHLLQQHGFVVEVFR